MELTVIGWNLKAVGGARNANTPLPPQRTDLIAAALSESPAICGLQEVTPGYSQCLEGLRYSLERRPPGKFDGGNRMLGVGLLVSPAVEVLRWGVIERAPFPDRTLTAEIRVSDQPINVIVFHSLTGVDYRRAKTAQFRSIAEHLDGLDGDVVLMGDANEPEVDPPDPNQISFWKRNGDGAELLFGPTPMHDLKDAWRAYLGTRVSELPAEGPLAVSHRTRGTDRRYDHVYIPKSWTVTHMEYAYETATRAGSDHALVTARVEVD